MVHMGFFKFYQLTTTFILTIGEKVLYDYKIIWRIPPIVENTVHVSSLEKINHCGTTINGIQNWN